MRAAYLTYLTHAWTADRYRPSVMHPRGPRAGPTSPGHPRAPIARALPAVVARRPRG